MCGIVGFINKDHERVNKSNILSAMLSAISHRGPDDEGTFVDGQIAIGVKRLSIIDIDGGHQPLLSENGALVLVCNGEIYNHCELRQSLIRNGHVFSSHTDIEVIVHLFEEYRYDCLDKLEGMFAFALWDRKGDELFVARDRFGIKPLYYWHDSQESHLVFASELGSILKYPYFHPKMDWISLRQYLQLEYVPSPRSIYKQVNKLPAAHWLSYKQGQLKVKRYWDITLGYKEEPANAKDVQERLFSMLQVSTRRHLISEAPLGIFLSGGVDSSTLVALASEVQNEKIQTFSMGFEEKSFDESEYSREVAAIFHTEHHHFSFDCSELVDTIDDATTYLDEPLADGSFFPTFALARQARKHVKVVLSGEGADEIFAGYPTYQAHAVFPFYDCLPDIIKNRLLPQLIRSLPVSLADFSLDFKLKKFVSARQRDALGRHLEWMGAFSNQEIDELSTSKIRDAMLADNAWCNIDDICRDVPDIITRLQYFDIKTYLQDNLLTKADRAGMSHGLEVRVPYLDHKIVEFVMRLPLKFRLRHLQGKLILKKLAARMLPAHIVYRNKKGFGMPSALWLRTGFKRKAQGILEYGCIRDSGLFNYGYVCRIMAEHFRGSADHRKKLWTLIMLEMWLRKHGQLL